MPKEKQPDLPGMPADSKIAKAAKKLASKREELAEEKLEIEKLEKELMTEMKAEKSKRFRINDGVSNFEVNLVESSEHIRIKKITKQRRDHEKAQSND